MSLEGYFSVISDGMWHSLEQLSKQLRLQKEKIEKLSELLSKHDIISYEEENHRIRLRPLGKLLIPEEEEPREPNNTVATIIIPSKSTVNIQSTFISNLSDFDLELTLRFNDKIKDVIIAA